METMENIHIEIKRKYSGGHRAHEHTRRRAYLAQVSSSGGAALVERRLQPAKVNGGHPLAHALVPLSRGKIHIEKKELREGGIARMHTHADNTWVGSSQFAPIRKRSEFAAFAPHFAVGTYCRHFF